MQQSKLSQRWAAFSLTVTLTVDARWAGQDFGASKDESGCRRQVANVPYSASGVCISVCSTI
jgi:hypothetical protein